MILGHIASVVPNNYALKDRHAGMYEAVLVPTDGSKLSKRAADHALEIARQFGSTVHALYVIDDQYTRRVTEVAGELSRNTPEIQELEEYREITGDKLTAEVIQHAHEAGLNAESTVINGDPADVITEFAESEGIDLIVIGARGRSAVGKYFLGDVAGKVARHATMPVMLVRADESRID